MKKFFHYLHSIFVKSSIDNFIMDLLIDEILAKQTLIEKISKTTKIKNSEIEAVLKALRDLYNRHL